MRLNELVKKNERMRYKLKQSLKELNLGELSEETALDDEFQKTDSSNENDIRENTEEESKQSFSEENGEKVVRSSRTKSRLSKKSRASKASAGSKSHSKATLMGSHQPISGAMISPASQVTGRGATNAFMMARLD